MSRNSSHGAPGGFTLVELLVVIAIIGVLAGLTTTAVFVAMRTARDSVVKSQIGQIETALTNYKNEFGEYPPSLADKIATMRHARSRWKRASLSYEDDILAAAGVAVSDAPAVKHAASLAFWLGGVRVGDEHVGFSADLSAPFKPTGPRDPKSFLDLNEKTVGEFLIGDAETPVFMFYANDAPIVYFRASSTTGYGNEVVGFTCVDFPEFGVAVPYAQGGPETGPKWHADKTFQLIHPGADLDFGGQGRVPPADSEDEDATSDPSWFAVTADGRGISSADLDNIVSFTEEATLEGVVDR